MWGMFKGGGSNTSGHTRTSSAMDDPLSAYNAVKQGNQVLEAEPRTHRRSMTLPSFRRRFSLTSSLTKDAAQAANAASLQPKPNIPDAGSSVTTGSLPSDSPPHSPHGTSSARAHSPSVPLVLNTDDEKTAPLPPLHRSNTISNGRRSSRFISEIATDLTKSGASSSAAAAATTTTGPVMKADSASLNTQESFSDPVLDKTRLSQKASTDADTATMILEFLYVSGEEVAMNHEKLVSELGITHVINAASSVCPSHIHKEIEYVCYYLEDVQKEMIWYYILHSIDVIEKVRLQGGRCLIHCQQGISRSTSLVIAYLMWHEHMDQEQAYQFVRSRRRTCAPNLGFVQQLKEWGTYLKPRPPPANPLLLKVGPHSEKDPSLIVAPLFATQSLVAVSDDPNSPPQNDAALASSSGKRLTVRKKSSAKREITPFSSELMNTEVYVLLIPETKAICIWIGESCPSRQAYEKVAFEFARMLSQYYPLYEKAQILTITSRSKAESSEQEMIFWNALEAVNCSLVPNQAALYY